MEYRVYNHNSLFVPWSPSIKANSPSKKYQPASLVPQRWSCNSEGITTYIFYLNLTLASSS